jgi:hypothetical protein
MSFSPLKAFLNLRLTWGLLIQKWPSSLAAAVSVNRRASPKRYFRRLGTPALESRQNVELP